MFWEGLITKYTRWIKYKWWEDGLNHSSMEDRLTTQPQCGCCTWLLPLLLVASGTRETRQQFLSRRVCMGWSRRDTHSSSQILQRRPVHYHSHSRGQGSKSVEHRHKWVWGFRLVIHYPQTKQMNKKPIPPPTKPKYKTNRNVILTAGLPGPMLSKSVSLTFFSTSFPMQPKQQGISVGSFLSTLHGLLVLPHTGWEDLQLGAALLSVMYSSQKGSGPLLVTLMPSSNAT